MGGDLQYTLGGGGEFNRRKAPIKCFIVPPKFALLEGNKSCKIVFCGEQFPNPYKY